VAALGNDPLFPLLYSREPSPHVTSVDRLNAEPNPLIFGQTHVLQRLEYAVLINCVNLSHDRVTSSVILQQSSHILRAL
jgi:hypothetical protein